MSNLVDFDINEVEDIISLILSIWKIWFYGVGMEEINGIEDWVYN